MGENGVFVFPDAAAKGAVPSIDPNLLLALNQNGGFGNSSWIWLFFMWMMWGGNGYGSNYDANAGRDLIMQGINGRADALGQLAQITNTNVEAVKSVLNNISTAMAQVGGQIGMSGLQVQNAIESGNAAISQQLCQCCCENRLAIANQTSALQSSLAAHDASVRLQLAQNEAADQLAVCQQTNALTSQASNNTNSILGAIQAQNTLITKEFCDLKERELQNKINTQGDIITQLRNQISNDKQTLQFNAAFHALDDKIDAIAAKQPNTVPVQYPNLVAVNQTPYAGNYYGNGNSFWG